jgi:hypothetical protein
MKPVGQLVWKSIIGLAGLSLLATANGSAPARTRKHPKPPAANKQKPQLPQAPPAQQPPPQQSAAQEAAPAPPARSLGSGDALPVASSGEESDLSLGAFGAFGRGFSLSRPERLKIIGAAVPGLAGAVWSDRDNDGVVDGYSYKGQYYPGTPPTAPPPKAPERE